MPSWAEGIDSLSFRKSLSFDERQLDDVVPAPKIRMSFKLLFLFCCLVYPLGAQSMYDAPAAIGTPFTKWFAIDDAQYGLLYSIAALPNFIIVLFVGAFVDRVGPNVSGFMFNIMIVGGSTMMWFAGHNYPILLSSFALFGVGQGSILLSQMVILSKWFEGRLLDMSFSLSTTVLRIQSTLDYNVTPVLAERRDVSHALTFPFAVSLVAFGATMISIIVDVYCYPKPASLAAPTKWPSLTSLRNLPLTYWLCVIVCVGLTAGDFLFEMYGPRMFEDKYQITAEEAGRAISLVSVAIVVTTPAAAYLSEYAGRTPLMIAGGIFELSGCVLTILEQDLGMWTCYASSILYGMGYAFAVSVVYTAVVKTVDGAVLGTAFGIMSGVLNFMLFFAPYLIGYLQVKTGGYFFSKLVILSFSGFGTVGGVLLLCTKHDIDSHVSPAPTPRSRLSKSNKNSRLLNNNEQSSMTATASAPTKKPRQMNGNHSVSKSSRKHSRRGSESISTIGVMISSAGKAAASNQPSAPAPNYGTTNGSGGGEKSQRRLANRSESATALGLASVSESGVGGGGGVVGGAGAGEKSVGNRSGRLVIRDINISTDLLEPEHEELDDVGSVHSDDDDLLQPNGRSGRSARSGRSGPLLTPRTPRKCVIC